MLEAWLKRITEELDRHNQANPDRPAAPFAVNQIVHRSNTRLERDLEICARWKVPIWITSLGARVGGERGRPFLRRHRAARRHQQHLRQEGDREGRRRADRGGRRARAAMPGRSSPFALVREIREWFDGPLLLSGAIATGRALLAAQAMGADLGYIGSPFIATEEANAAARLQADDRRERGRGHRDLVALHRRLGQLPQAVDRARGAGPRQPRKAPTPRR